MGGAPHIASWQITLGVALFALGFLVTTQLRSEAPIVRYTSQERAPLVETALGLQSQQEGLKARILQLRSRIQDLEQQGQGSQELVVQLNDAIDAAHLAAGLVTLQGTGVVLQLQDSTTPVQPGDNTSDYLVSAADIRTVVEELWLADAEAIAVNGERVTASTAILDIGGSVLVNSAYLAPPYQVAAIGPPDIYTTLSASPGFRDFVHARAERFGIRLSFAELPNVVVPAYAGVVDLRYARTVTPSLAPSPRPTPTAAPAGPASPGADAPSDVQEPAPSALAAGGR